MNIMETLSLDPTLFWPTGVLDLIFQHLTAKEILSTLLVSSSWEDHIGSSSTCMNKINLTIIGRKYFLSGRDNEMKDEVKMLSASRRRYTNLTLYAQKPGSLTKDLIELLSSRQGKWKNVKIWSEKFQDEAQFEFLLKLISESAESVDLRNISFVQSLETFEPSDIIFPKLKSLSICNVKSFGRIIKFFNGTSNLESLEIENGCEELLKDFPSNFNKKWQRVKKLSIIEDKWNEDFFNKLSQVNFNLDDIKIKLQSSECPESQVGLIRFIKAQRAVSKLIIDLPINVDVLHKIFELPKLKVLHLMTPIDHGVVVLADNPSIIELKVNFVCSQDFLISMLEASPNRKVLTIPSI